MKLEKLIEVTMDMSTADRRSLHCSITTDD